MNIRSIKVKFENLSNDCDFLHDYHYDNLEYDKISQSELRGHLGSLLGAVTKYNKQKLKKLRILIYGEILSFS